MKHEIQILNENVVFDTFAVFTFLKRLVTPFEKTDAFRLGIIDKDGKFLKKRSELKTSEERSACDLFDVVVFNLKKLLAMIPFGKTVIASYIAALFLLKEQKNLTTWADEDLLFEGFMDFYEASQFDAVMREKLKKIFCIEDGEGVPIANAHNGNLAGVDDGLTVVKNQPKILKRKEVDLT